MSTDNRPDAAEQDSTYGAGPASGYSAVNDSTPASAKAEPYPAYGGGYPGPQGVPPPLGAPNPGLAALLGFIPGVGAMYNGQFAKGLAHIAIFAVFCSLSKNVNGIFGLFIAGWVLYMAFEAYQTALARRDGLPLPDPFGLNNVGERFGFRGNPNFASFWAHGVPPTPSNPSGSPFGTPPPPYAPDAVSGRPSYQVDPAGNVYRTAGVSEGQTPFNAPPPYGPPPSYSPYGTPAAPYAAPDGASYSGHPVPPAPPTPPLPPVRGTGLPAGALWLIGLGLFALLGSIRAFDFLEGEATGGIFLIGLSLFLFWRRWSVNRTLYPEGSPAARWSVLQGLRGSGVLFVVGLLTLLQGLRVVYWENSWPFLLIFLGVFLLMERLAFNQMNTAPTYTPYSAQATPSATEQSSETASATSILPRYITPRNDLQDREGQ